MGACLSYIYGLIFGYGDNNAEYTQIPTTDIESRQESSVSSSNRTNQYQNDSKKPNSDSTEIEMISSRKEDEEKPKAVSAKVQVQYTCEITIVTLLK